MVVARDRAQPEATQSLDDYLTARLSADAHRHGPRAPSRLTRTLLDQRVEDLRRAAADDGRVLGPRIQLRRSSPAPTRRSRRWRRWPTTAAGQIFRDELIAALKIIDAGTVTAADLKGSWAGAMGQPQFMPSSYLAHAVDFDADGHADIWTSLPDVFASMANYLKKSGWQAGEGWGREVTISKARWPSIDKDRADAHAPAAAR